MKGYIDENGKDRPPCGSCVHKNESTTCCHCYNCIDNTDLALHKPNSETEFVNYKAEPKIEFIEKEPYESYDRFNHRDSLLYPNYMVKDGKEHFMFNRRVPDDKWARRGEEGRKQLLTENGGKYFVFHSAFTDPFEMLLDIAQRRHHFSDPDSLYIGSLEKTGHFDFLGNRKELSAAYHYRIYNADMVAEIKEVVDMLKREEYEAVCKKLEERAAQQTRSAK